MVEVCKCIINNRGKERTAISHLEKAVYILFLCPKLQWRTSSALNSDNASQCLVSKLYTLSGTKDPYCPRKANHSHWVYTETDKNDSHVCSQMLWEVKFVKVQMYFQSLVTVSEDD